MRAECPLWNSGNACCRYNIVEDKIGLAPALN
jgi:hypothetical protein